MTSRPALNIDAASEPLLRELLAHYAHRDNARLLAFGNLVAELRSGEDASFENRLKVADPALYTELGGYLAKFGNLMTEISAIGDAEEARILSGEATPPKPTLN